MAGTALAASYFRVVLASAGRREERQFDLSLELEAFLFGCLMPETRGVVRSGVVFTPTAR
jgi:hypothetical protein